MEWNRLKYLMLIGVVLGAFILDGVTSEAEAAAENEEEEEGEIEGTEPDKYPTDNEVFVLGKDNFDEFIQVCEFAERRQSACATRIS